MFSVWNFTINFVIFLMQFYIVSSKVGFGEWGDACNNTEECSDHRFVCTLDEFNVSRCLCDKFHKWFNVSLGCIQMYNDTDIINSTVTEEIDKLGELENYNQVIFNVQAAAGIFVFGMVIIASFTIISYCIYMWRSDKVLENSLESAIKAKKQVAPPLTRR